MTDLPNFNVGLWQFSYIVGGGGLTLVRGAFFFVGEIKYKNIYFIYYSSLFRYLINVCKFLECFFFLLLNGHFRITQSTEKST